MPPRPLLPIFVSLPLACTSPPETGGTPDPAREASSARERLPTAVEPGPRDPDGLLVRAAGIELVLPRDWTILESSPRHAIAGKGEHRCVVMGARMGIALPEGTASTAASEGHGLRIESSAERTLRVRDMGSAVVVCGLHRADASLHAQLDAALAGARAHASSAPDAPSAFALVDICVTADHEGRHRHVYALGREGHVWSGPLEAEQLEQSPGLSDVQQIRCGRQALARTHDGRVYAADASAPTLSPARMPEDIAATLSVDGVAPAALHLQPDAVLLAATRSIAGPRGPSVARVAREGTGAWTLDAGEPLPEPHPRHRGRPGTSDEGLVGARVAVTATVPGRGCAVTDDGWLWCWTDDGRPGKFPAVRWNPEDGVPRWSGARDLGFPPVRIDEIVDAHAEVVDLFAPTGQARICVETEHERRCIGPDGAVTVGPRCSTVSCACRFDARFGEQCEDEVIDPSELLRGEGVWMYDVRDHDGPCVLRASDQPWCRPAPGAPHRAVALHPSPRGA